MAGCQEDSLKSITGGGGYSGILHLSLSLVSGLELIIYMETDS